MLASTAGLMTSVETSVTTRAPLITFSKGEARHPHPLDVVNTLLLIAKERRISGIEQNTSVLDLKELMENALQELSTKYDSSVSFKLFHNDLNDVVKNTQSAIESFFAGKTDAKDLAGYELKMKSLRGYGLLFDAMGFKHPGLMLLFPCVDGRSIPPSDFCAFICELDVCYELDLMVGETSGQTVH